MSTLRWKVGANKGVNTARSLCLHLPLFHLPFYCYFTFRRLLVSKILTRYTRSFESIFKRQKFANLLKPVATDASVLNIIVLRL